MYRLITPSYSEFVRHFGRVVQVGLQEGGVNSFGVFHRIPMNLDTVVIMGLVRHPMCVVVISSPI